MRPILAIALAFGLLLAPVALASGADESARGKGRETAEAHGAFERQHAAADENETESDNETAAQGRGRSAAREANAEAHAEGAANRPAWVDRLLSFRIAWRENATAIREECHARETPDGDNWTKEQKLERAQCVRDGYKSFLDAFREELREMRQRVRHAAD